MSTSQEDKDVLRTARFVALEKANEWIGLPFDVGSVAARATEYVRRIPESIREQGFISWSFGIAFTLWMLWLLAPLREALMHLQLALAMLYINIWLFFLPFALIAAGFYLLQVFVALWKKPSVRRAQVVARVGIRVGLLASTFLIDVLYGQQIRVLIGSP